MSVIDSKGTLITITKRVTATATQCSSDLTYYSTTCLNGFLWIGCFSDPCLTAFPSGEQLSSFNPYCPMCLLFCKAVSLEHTKRAPQPACPAGYSYYNTTCNDTGYFDGCFNEAPCDDHVDDDSLTVVQTLGARGLTFSLFPVAAASSSSVAASSSSSAAASSSSAATTSTHTSAKSSSARPKTTSSSHLPPAPSQITSVISSSQTTSTTFSSQASSTTSTFPQTATPFAAISPAPTANVHSSQPHHSNTAAVAAGTVGAIVGAIIALMLILLALKRRKRRRKEKLQATEHSNYLQSQKFDKNGAGSASQDENAHGKSWGCTHFTPFPSKVSQQGASNRYLLDCVVNFLPSDQE